MRRNISFFVVSISLSLVGMALLAGAKSISQKYVSRIEFDCQGLNDQIRLLVRFDNRYTEQLLRDEKSIKDDGRYILYGHVAGLLELIKSGYTEGGTKERSCIVTNNNPLTFFRLLKLSEHVEHLVKKGVIKFDLREINRFLINKKKNYKIVLEDHRDTDTLYDDTNSVYDMGPSSKSKKSEFIYIGFYYDKDGLEIILVDDDLKIREQGKLLINIESSRNATKTRLGASSSLKYYIHDKCFFDDANNQEKVIYFNNIRRIEPNGTMRLGQIRLVGDLHLIKLIRKDLVAAYKKNKLGYCKAVPGRPRLCIKRGKRRVNFRKAPFKDSKIIERYNERDVFYHIGNYRRMDDSVVLFHLQNGKSEEYGYMSSKFLEPCSN